MIFHSGGTGKLELTGGSRVVPTLLLKERTIIQLYILPLKTLLPIATGRDEGYLLKQNGNMLPGVESRKPFTTGEMRQRNSRNKPIHGREHFQMKMISQTVLKD